MTWLLAALVLILALVATLVGRNLRSRAEPPGSALVGERLDRAEKLILESQQHRRRFRQGLTRGLALGLALGLGAGIIIAMGMRVDPTKWHVSVGWASRLSGESPPEPFPVAPPATVSAEPPATVRAEPPATESGSTARPAKVRLVVDPGDSAPDAAAKLKSAGLITDESAFLARVQERHLGGLLADGTYLIPVEASTDEIIDTLTVN
ncbi:MAG TPA: hypothetical protein VGK74_27670 [Symbiobacteriaceae bacterium]